jgi:hypothetical protein
VLEDYATARQQAASQLTPDIVDRLGHEGSQYSLEDAVACATAVIEDILDAV